MEQEQEQEQEEQQQQMRSRSIHILPAELIIEILSRLPVESVTRCKSVCKSWLSSISDPSFVKYHLSLSHQRLIISARSRVVKGCSLSDVVTCDKSLDTSELDYPLKHLGRLFWIPCSCNGLLCVVVYGADVEDDSTVFLWNPSTRRSKRLPFSGIDPSIPLVYGLGYVESCDDYKVVFMARGRDGDDEIERVMIYFFKSGDWKAIGDYSHAAPATDFGLYPNGALYYWGDRPGTRGLSSLTIVSLDLATETYSELEQPVDVDDKSFKHLEVLGGWLALVCEYGESRKTDVWVMKQDSWTKVASIQDPPQGWLFPLTMVNDGHGQLLFRCRKNLVLYDVKSGGPSKEIEIHDEIFEARVIVESLV